MLGFTSLPPKAGGPRPLGRSLGPRGGARAPFSLKEKGA